MKVVKNANLIRPTWGVLPLLPLLFGVVALTHRWWSARPLWLDEQMIARNIRDRDFAGLASALDHNQSAPLGWLWAQHAVVMAFGTGERPLRLIPLLFGVGALVLGWLIGRRWLGPVGCFAVVSLLAVNSSVLRYSAEVKQYTGDVFWVLMLLGVALWALEPPSGAAESPGPDPRRRALRVSLWWLAATVACLFSMGAILATPALALIVVGALAWRGRWRAAALAALPGIGWLTAFVVQYWFALRHVRSNQMMVEFWARLGYPPEGAGPLGIVIWSVRRMEALAADPLGLDNAALGRGWLLFAGAVFWFLVLTGVLLATRVAVPIGMLLAAPAAAGLVLAVLRVAPLTVRLAMWIVPALFLAVGFAIDAAARSAARLLRRPVGWPTGWLLGGSGAALTLVAAVAFAPLAGAALRQPGPPGIDDRAGVTWLVRQHRPGDLTLVIHGSHHAVAWYAPGDLLEPQYRVRLTASSAGCDPDVLRARVAGFDRVLVYGRIRAGAAGRAAEVLTARLTELGTVLEAADAGGVSISRIVQLRPEPDRPPNTDTSACLSLT